MSRRCPGPDDCQCPALDDEGLLKCGPCDKCKRQAKIMDSSLMTEEETLKCQENQDDTSDDKWDSLIRHCVTGQPIIWSAKISQVCV